MKHLKMLEELKFGKEIHNIYRATVDKVLHLMNFNRFINP